MLIWIRRILLGMLLLVMAVFGAVLLVEPSFSLIAYREAIAQALSQRTGREIQLDGEIQLTLGRHLRLAVDDIRIANPPWSQAPQLLTASETAVGIDLLALFSGVIHVQEVKLRNAIAALEVSPSGAQSWEFRADTQPEPERDEDKDSTLPNLVLEAALIEGVSLTYRDPRYAKPLELRLESFKQHNDQGMLALEASGRLNDLGLQAAGRIGSLEALLRGRQIDVDLQASLDQTNLTLQGHLGEPARLEDIELVASIQGPSFKRLLQAFGIAYEHSGDIDMQLHVMDRERGFAWASKGHMGALMINTQGTLERPLTWNDLQADVHIHGKDLSKLGQIMGVQTLPEQAYQLTGQVSRDADGLVLRDIKLESGDARIEASGEFPLFPNLEKAAARLHVNLPQPNQFAALLGRDLGPLDPLRIEASLIPADNGDETVAVRLDLGKNQANIKGRLGKHPDYHATRLDFLMTGPSLGALASAAGRKGLPAQAYRFAGEFEVDSNSRLLLKLPEGRLGELRLAAEGSLGRVPALDGMELQVTAQGDSLQASAATWSEVELPDLPFQLGSRVSGKLFQPRIRDLNVQIGKAQLRASGSIGLPPHLTGTDAKFELSVPDLAELWPAHRRADWPGGHYRSTGKLVKTRQAWELRDVQVSGEQLKMALSATIPATGVAGTALRLEATAANLAAVMPPLPHYHPSEAPIVLDVQLQSSPSQLEIKRFSAVMGDAKLNGTGRIALKEKSDKRSFKLQATGPRLSDLGKIEGIVLPAQAFQLDATLRQIGKRLEISDLHARVGEGKLTGTLHIEQRKRPYVEMQASLQRFNIGEFLPPAEPTKGPGVDKTAAAQSAQGRLIPDGEPDLRFLDVLDGHFKIRFEGLGYPDPIFPGKVAFEDVELDAKLDAGNLLLNRLWSTGERGEAVASGRLTRKGRIVSIDWQLQARDFRLGLLGTAGNLDELPAHKIDLELTSRGRTYRDHAASVNGRLFMTGGSGRSNNTALNRVYGSFFDELITTVNPFAKQEKHTKIECTAAAMAIQAGVIRLDPGAVTRTDKIDISLGGTIDLKKEVVDMQFRNAPRKGIGLSAAGLVRPFIKVGGPLKQPDIQLDPGKALLSGTAAVATSGLSLIASSLFDRLSTATNPCEKIIAEADIKRHPKPAKKPHAD